MQMCIKMCIRDSFTIEDLKGILEVKNDEWTKEADEITEYFKTFDRLPQELKDQLAALKSRLQ